MPFLNQISRAARRVRLSRRLDDGRFLWYIRGTFGTYHISTEERAYNEKDAREKFQESVKKIGFPYATINHIEIIDRSRASIAVDELNEFY